MMSLENQKWDVAIIGGGLAGLTAAIFLAKAGKKVLVLEKAKNLGGRAITEEKSGCFFNLGPHALYKKGMGMKILNELGVFPEGGTPDIGGKLIYQGKVYSLPVSPFSLIQTKLLSWREKKEFIKLMVNLPKKDPDSLHSLSLWDWSHENIHSEKVRQLLYMFIRLATYANNPKQMSAGAAIRQLKLSSGGALYVNGGWQTIIEQLKEKAIAAGAFIREEQIALEISGTTPDMNLYLVDGIKIETRFVLSTTGPSDTYKMLRNAEQTSLARIKETSIPVKAACMDIALNSLPKPKNAFALGLDQPIYYSNHSKAAKLSRDPEHAVVHLLKYLSPEDDLEMERHKRDLEETMNLLHPGWQNHVISSRFLPHMTVFHRLPLPNEALQTEITDIPGLFVAGDWITSQGLLADASLSSAKEAALRILKRDKEVNDFVGFERTLQEV
jgi:phytoene dehydrogenase-like protein